jgi:hypothetical protein
MIINIEENSGTMSPLAFIRAYLIACIVAYDQRCQMAVVTATFQKCGSFTSWMSAENWLP